MYAAKRKRTLRIDSKQGSETEFTDRLQTLSREKVCVYFVCGVEVERVNSVDINSRDCYKNTLVYQFL